MPANENQLLADYKRTGSREDLLALLRAHQDRIYNVCFQVLRRTEDAEDASQETLLRLAEGARSAPDADAFAAWIYRVSLRAALDRLRRRETARYHELRSAMSRPASVPFDDEEHRALFEAMERLEDGDRTLVIQHYFEKVSLDELGARQGLSAVAIWKRIDRAREKLKKLLLGAGFAAASARMAEALESSVRATAPPTLVGEAILGKILAGGVTMAGAKTSSITISVVAIILLFAVTVGGILAARPWAPKSADRAASPPSPAPLAAGEPAVPQLPETLPIVVPESKVGPLVETLKRYKAWHAEWMRRARAALPSDDREALSRLQREGWSGFKEAFEQINDDPTTFLKFIQDPANEELLGGIIINLLGKLEPLGQGTGRNAQKFKDFSQELMDGFFALLKSGTPPLRNSILGFLGSVHDVPESYDVLYEELMYDPDVGVQRGALYARWRQRPLDMATLEKILARYQTTTDPMVQLWAIKAISYSPKPETLEWMLRSLESTKEPDLSYRMASAAASMTARMTLDGETSDRLVRGLIATFEKLSNEHQENDLLWSALYMAPKDSRRVLEAALPKASSPKLKAAIKFTLEKADEGSPTWNDLQNHFWRMMK